MDETRIDKWLWAVRLFKTRSLATDACRGGRVRIGDTPVKPAHVIRIGDVVALSVPPIERRYRVVGILEKRVSATLARGLLEEVTPPEDLARLEEMRRDPDLFFVALRARGSGRPTKRERRDLGKLQDRWKEG
ncbi:MAG TPA: RNA-binding S4 domain-containing protein [Candidatus Aminicenantes bacterium]|nr:RNA-binding S4 domain-containing protein [Candidatus Aminicenantes bacterium]